MKVKDLIKELEGANPEAEVVVDGSAVFCEGPLPGYYDGFYSRAIFDESGCHTGIIYTRKGSKFSFRKIDVYECIFDEPDSFVVDWDEDNSPYSYFTPDHKKAARLSHEAVRWESRQFKAGHSELPEWLPLKNYEESENPYKEHLPENWE